MTGLRTTMGQVRERQITAMRLSLDILEHILKGVPAEKARRLRDGDDGWSVIEILCHLRDFDEIFYNRAQMMLNEDHPQLPAYDHEAMAIEGAYQQEQLGGSLAALKASRKRFVGFFETLTPAQWERAGVHPERDSFTLTDALMQVGLHDLDHLEQITRVLSQE